MKKQMNVGKTIAVIVCVFLLVLAVGSIAFFTNGFTSDFKTFYVESDGKRMLSDYDNYIMKQDAENKFVVKYTFGAVNKDISGYTLKLFRMCRTTMILTSRWTERYTVSARRKISQKALTLSKTKTISL